MCSLQMNPQKQARDIEQHTLRVREVKEDKWREVQPGFMGHIQ